jgi:DNA-directed RNA polymerase specialized sigma24 family protein
MPDPSSSTLAEFNRQVLLFQDEAFTLACDLLGDEDTASRVTQEAFEQVYSHEWMGNGSIRLPLLHRIILVYSESQIILKERKNTLLSKLPEPERFVLLLVDHLCLTYEETSRVLHCSPDTVASRLAHARWKIADYNNIGLRNIHAEDKNPGG